MGAWQEIVDYTVPSNTTSVVLDSFGTITKDDFVKVSITHVNGSSSSVILSVFPNTTAGVSGYNTQTNYTSQLLIGNDSFVNSLRINRNEVTFVGGSSTNYSLIYLKLSENNTVNFLGNNFRTIDSSLQTRFFYTTSNNLTFNDPITSLTFTSDQTNGIGTGSRIQIYKLAAEKVADITVGSNTTQVDISSLSIDKDSEYLLIQNGVPNTLDSIYGLYVNDDITGTNYYYQFIGGSGSSASAGRTNNSFTVPVRNANEYSVCYSHIKLSNIGAATFQTYALVGVGSTVPQVTNAFASTTSESITSITKLNIRSTITNGIGAGSRFTLYKLYE
jgi:hypothetical protein